MEKAYYCYILSCANGTFYTGWTTDPARREKQHNQGVGSKYTRTHRPVTLVYLELLASRSDAMKREMKIKHLSHDQKLKLIQSKPYGKD